MKDKTIVITGGSSGIGKGLAEEFGGHGSKILITGRNAADLDAAVIELRHRGITIAGLISDVSKEADNKKMVEEAVRLYGKIDVR